MENEMLRQNTAAVRKGIPGSTIKIIAVITMLIDHIGAVILERFMVLQAQGGMINETLELVDTVLRMIGRLGFPIFCFLLVEGFEKTKNLKKYLTRLILFALLSEIPFNLSISGTILSKNYQNVYFTLLIGILALCGMRAISKRPDETKSSVKGALMAGGAVLAGLYGWIVINNIMMLSFRGIGGGQLIKFAVQSFAPIAFVIVALVWTEKGFWRILGQLGLVCLMMFLADNLRTDYGGMGVAAIVVMYLLREKKLNAFFFGTLALSIANFVEFAALFAMIPISKYNGERGLKLKYFFYAFYPVHLFILWLIALILGVGFVSVG